MRGGNFRQAGIDLFQLAQETLRFRELIENRVVGFGELARNRRGQLDQALAVARQFVAR